jgi:PAS domain S-box-containing protein
VATAPRFSRKSAELALGYAAALLLPWVAITLSLKLHFLHDTPLALSFVVIAVISTLFDRNPALLSLLATAILFNVEMLGSDSIASLQRTTVLQTLAIFAVGLILVFITQTRRRALKHLQERTDALVQAQRVSHTAAWKYDAKTGITHWYPGGAELFGRPQQEITAMGSPTQLLVPEDLPGLTAALNRTHATGEPFHSEFRVIWPNGDIHWLEARGAPTPSDSTAWHGVTMDITERKQTEAALLQAEKLAAAGRLTSSMAHEINNPLESLTNLVYLASVKAIDDETKAYLAQADTELRRLALVANQTLQFHKQPTEALDQDLAEMLRDIFNLYRSRFSSRGIEAALHVKGCCDCLCHPTELRQVLITLIGNAVDAMPDGGSLRARVRAATDWRSGTPGVRISIADTGHGMSPAVRRRIYEPFFTTKEEVANGLGLWAAAGIVGQHRGSLHVRSSTSISRGRGTAFTLVLPSSQPPPGPAANLQPLEPALATAARFPLPTRKPAHLHS